MPRLAASAAAFTARSIDSRSTPGIAIMEELDFLPSTTKIGQIRSSTVSVVSRTSRRDQSVLRFRRGRTAGKPWLSTAGSFAVTRLIRSFLSAMVLYLVGAIEALFTLPVARANYHSACPSANCVIASWLPVHWQKEE